MTALCVIVLCLVLLFCIYIALPFLVTSLMNCLLSQWQLHCYVTCGRSLPYIMSLEFNFHYWYSNIVVHQKDLSYCTRNGKIVIVNSLGDFLIIDLLQLELLVLHAN